MEDFVLTKENYYSQEADLRYMSFHQYLSFAGGMIVEGCEERAMKMLAREWVEPTTTAMLVGSYVDSYFEGTLDNFIEEHPECFTAKKELKAPFKQAEIMIARCEQDEYFMKTLSGEKQKIMTFYWEGCEWRMKMDSYLPHQAIVDLKTCADIHKAWRVRDYGYTSFIEAYAYDEQLALYQKGVEIVTGEKLPCYISAVTKSDSPEIAVINIDQVSLDSALDRIKMNMPSVLAVKNGEALPTRCGRCDYCKATHVITRPINMRDLIDAEF